jgi:hypothetical protein
MAAAAFTRRALSAAEGGSELLGPSHWPCNCEFHPQSPENDPPPPGRASKAFHPPLNGDEITKNARDLSDVFFRTRACAFDAEVFAQLYRY